MKTIGKIVILICAVIGFYWMIEVGFHRETIRENIQVKIWQAERN